MTILIDADGCPVVDIAVKIADEQKKDCVILCDTAHAFEKARAETITYAKGADNVGFALVNRVQAGEIVVTQDYGLALKVVPDAELYEMIQHSFDLTKPKHIHEKPR